MLQNKAQLRARALNYLARREYTRCELREKLLAAATPHPAETPLDEALPHALEIDHLLDEFQQRGWLSDQRAASQIVQRYQGKHGSQRIRHTLQQKGVDEALIDELMPQLKATEWQRAQTVWQKKFGQLPEDDRQKARQIRFLQSRGFSMEVIFKILDARADEWE